MPPCMQARLYMREVFLIVLRSVFFVFDKDEHMSHQQQHQQTQNEKNKIKHNNNTPPAGWEGATLPHLTPHHLILPYRSLPLSQC